MRYLLALIALFAFFGAVGLGMQIAIQPSVTFLIVPDATNIQLIERSMGERLIVYGAPGSPYAWRAVVERELVTHKWAQVPPIWWRPDMAPTFTYFHVSSFWFGAIWDEVDLQGESNVARISVRRWIESPSQWKRWWLHLAQNIAA